MSHRDPSAPSRPAHHHMGHARIRCAQIIHNPQSGNNTRSKTFPTWTKQIRNARYRPAFLQLQWGLKTLKKDQRPSGLLGVAGAASGLLSFIPILPYLVSIFGSLVTLLLGALPQRPRLRIDYIYRRAFASQFLFLSGWTKPSGISVPIVNLHPFKKSVSRRHTKPYGTGGEKFSKTLNPTW